MTAPLRLIVFDVDGTLIDSQAAIVAAMRAAFEAVRAAPPERARILSIVGLSLPIAVAHLAPGETAARQAAITQAYREAFVALRAAGEGEGATPLFPGVHAALERLNATGALLAVATGKARRGLEHALDRHDLRSFFIATQTADDAPSKPHPAMIENLLAATGAEARHTVMIGDTTFDMEMARAAGAAALGVSWGYHAVEDLVSAGAAAVVDSFDALDDALQALPGVAA